MNIMVYLKLSGPMAMFQYCHVCLWFKVHSEQIQFLFWAEERKVYKYCG